MIKVSPDGKITHLPLRTRRGVELCQYGKQISARSCGALPDRNYMTFAKILGFAGKYFIATENQLIVAGNIELIEVCNIELNSLCLAFSAKNRASGNMISTGCC